MSHPRVFNARAGAAKGHPRPWRYVGRGRCPCGQTSCAHGPFGLGNPYTVEADGPECMLLYVTSVAKRVRTQPAFNVQLDDLEPFDLFCWCAPDTCHADVLARVSAVRGVEARLEVLREIYRELREAEPAPRLSPTTRAPKHACHAEGCQREVPPRLLMCPKHWGIVPPALQRAVWAHYVPGQEQRKDPTTEYLRAAADAIAAVAHREGLR